MTSALPWLLGFMFLGGAWIFVISLMCLPLTRLPLVQQRFPSATMTSSAMMLGGFAALLAAFGLMYALPQAQTFTGLFKPSELTGPHQVNITADLTTPPVTDGQAGIMPQGMQLGTLSNPTQETVTVYITSDPIGADVHIGEQLVGKTPLRQELRPYAKIQYAIVSDPATYKPYASKLNAGQGEKNLLVRFGSLIDTDAPEAEISEASLRPEQGLQVSPEIFVNGMVAAKLTNTSTYNYDYVVVSYRLLDAEQEVLGTVYDLIYRVKQGEDYDVNIPVGEIDPSAVAEIKLWSVLPMNPYSYSQKQ